MKMNLKYYAFGLLFYFYFQIKWCSSERMSYFSTEHPAVYSYDKTVLKNFSLFSKRVNRQDPKYYVEVYMHTLRTADNNISVDFYFYQFLTNRYKPSFVELHFKFCDMMNSDTLIGRPMRNALGGRRCPYPPGEYDMKNMTISYVPRGFPFTKGRIYCNATLTTGDVTKVILYGSIDMEIKAVYATTHTNRHKGMQHRRDRRNARP